MIIMSELRKGTALILTIAGCSTTHARLSKWAAGIATVHPLHSVGKPAIGRISCRDERESSLTQEFLVVQASIFSLASTALAKGLLLLLQRGFYCSCKGASTALAKELLLLLQRGFYCSCKGASTALAKGLLLLLQRGFYCSCKGATTALAKGLLLLLQRGFYCSCKGASTALAKGLLLLLQRGFYCSC